MRKILLSTIGAGISFALAFSSFARAEEGGFPYMLPEEKPNRKLSAAVERNYTAYLAPRPEDNELYSQFRYTKLEGFDYNGGDGTIIRRDPSKVIFANGKYYVWYTYRHSEKPMGGCNWCDIWYATSKDGFAWEEQGPAVTRPPEPSVGWSSVLTTDVLIWKGKYYLYYQAFSGKGGRTEKCPVLVSWADSPDGPWIPTGKIVIPCGGNGELDQYSIHDPYPLVYKDKIYLYYKSDFDGEPRLVRMQGLAIADDPLGPFEKHRSNPIMNSGHETTMFPFKEGIAAIVIKDGNEHFTVQYAPDGANFEMASITQLMPEAAGPFVSDAFTNTKHGKGITWGLCHANWAGAALEIHSRKTPAFIGPGDSEGSRRHQVLMRFDCDLSLDNDYPEFKEHRYLYNPEFYYAHGLSEELREKIEADTREQNPLNDRQEP